jgi:hypothetical protein
MCVIRKKYNEIIHRTINKEIDPTQLSLSKTKRKYIFSEIFLIITRHVCCYSFLTRLFAAVMLIQRLKELLKPK